MPFTRKFGVLASGATAIAIPMIKRGAVDFAASGDWTLPVAGDVKVSLDNGAYNNIANLPFALPAGNGGATWVFILTSGELVCKQVSVVIVDASTKAIEDNMFTVETYGNPSAMYPVDFSDNIRMGLTSLPLAAAATAGGLPTVDAGNAVLVRGLVKRNVAFPNFSFLLTDSTTHGPKTSAASLAATRRIDAAAFGATANAPTEVANGVYTIDLAAADVNGRVIMLRITATNADDRFIQIITID